MADNEITVISPLLMDRAEPLGNSLGNDARRALHVKVKNDPDEPIFVVITTAAANPFFATSEPDLLTTPGLPQTLITGMVGLGVTRRFTRATVRCRATGVFYVLQDTTIIGSGCTDSPQQNVSFVWDPGFPIATGLSFSLVFTSSVGTPVASIEAYLMGEDDVF